MNVVGITAEVLRAQNVLVHSHARTHFKKNLRIEILVVKQHLIKVVVVAGRSNAQLEKEKINEEPQDPRFAFAPTGLSLIRKNTISSYCKTLS